MGIPGIAVGRNTAGCGRGGRHRLLHAPAAARQHEAPRAEARSSSATRNGTTAPTHPALHAALQRLRVDTLTTYGMREVLAAQGLAPAEVQARIERMAAVRAAREFDPYSLIVLLRAALAFDVRFGWAQSRPTR